jgi:sterol desaturase/sphingolipid hydroxylase (fatty acid hydroxylase superfamily)
MNPFPDILHYEPYLRAGGFFAVLLVVGFFEVVVPRRRAVLPRKVRWFSNLMVHFLNAMILRLLLPVLPIGVAIACMEKGWGLLNQYPLRPALTILISVVLLDLIIYLQHVLFHKIPILWRLHKVHHMDLHIDVTTGVRFHPLEIVLSALIKIAVVFLVGPPAAAVLLFEIILNGTSMFNHGNIHIPERMDRMIRQFIVTPDMHRVHHSIIRAENNSNFGFSISLWDRLFGTYTPQPAGGHEAMVIGLREWRGDESARLLKLLTAPFLPDRRE